MIILSIDLGIKNLAFCKILLQKKEQLQPQPDKQQPTCDSEAVHNLLLKFNITILEWKIVNLLEEGEEKEETTAAPSVAASATTTATIVASTQKNNKKINKNKQTKKNPKTP